MQCLAARHHGRLFYRSGAPLGVHNWPAGAHWDFRLHAAPVGVRFLPKACVNAAWPAGAQGQEGGAATDAPDAAGGPAADAGAPLPKSGGVAGDGALPLLPGMPMWARVKGWPDWPCIL